MQFEDALVALVGGDFEKLGTEVDSDGGGVTDFVRLVDETEKDVGLASSRVTDDDYLGKNIVV